MACGEQMDYADLRQSGRELIAGGAIVYYTFCCPTCDEEVSIGQPNKLPDEAVHENCGTRVNPRTAGGWWSAVAVRRRPSGPLH